MTWAGILALLRGIPGLGRLLQSLGLMVGTATVVHEHQRANAAEAEADNLRRMAQVEPTRPDEIEDTFRKAKF